MTWHASLDLNYALESNRSVVRYSHNGPLRVLQSLYPEGPEVCHNVLVHPPGGLVGGDTLDIHVNVGTGAHGLITSPGATRYYRSEGERALQRTRLRLQAGSRMEWLPMEAILYNGCLAQSQFSFELDAGAELLAWDISALGLPHADKPFVRGSFKQQLEMPGIWLERGVTDASDTRLLNSPLGLAGQRCTATFIFAAGSPISRERRESALECIRQLLLESPHSPMAGVTSPNPQVLLLRALAPQVEPVMELFKNVWASWRKCLWNQPARRPRIWSM